MRADGAECELMLMLRARARACVRVALSVGVTGCHVIRGTAGGIPGLGDRDEGMEWVFVIACTGS